MPEDDRYTEYPHAPPHLFCAGACYFLTAKTVGGLALLQVGERRQQLIEALRFTAGHRRWELVAWVVLSNHYHCILKAPDDGASQLPRLIGAAHQFTATAWNREDRCPSRKVWYQYWDTCLTHVGSFYARLNYIHHNPVKHGLVARPEEYPFSSYLLWRDMEDVDLPLIEGGYPWNRLDLE